MSRPPRIVVIIPAFNEAESIALVLREIPAEVSHTIVVDNGSTDGTGEVAAKAGAIVVRENQKGYGYACLKGMRYISDHSLAPDIVVFLDGDYSDYPEYLTPLVAPIISGAKDLMVGARVANLREAGAMTFPQRFGNSLATFLMRVFFGSRFTDLGPFRAIRYESLRKLNMEDKTYGWTVEMQLKALKKGLRYGEIPVPYRNRIGVSKVSGTVKGAIFAGVKILGWIFKYSLKK
ncbi:glycosyltransferase family 2 protein [Altibacter sp. HG106]|uniref:glycosyltransferase family 2 protein n=1 Tax=Altibacter sp. HG106 TaxID=3023937 RepID=UPI002350A307|nr:glycosyltransferase family 2 protein [Altibacter sp. HG106]MDC7994226.1 glycosyltransferase family 2 protein [Altibacter sp. HG106]